MVPFVKFIAVRENDYLMLKSLAKPKIVKVKEEKFNIDNYIELTYLATGNDSLELERFSMLKNL